MAFGQGHTDIRSDELRQPRPASTTESVGSKYATCVGIFTIGDREH